MYIQKLRLKDFQSHKDTLVELSNGFNCIVGSTNSGKSSILRALKFILVGEPWDKSFVRDGAEYAEIELYLSDGNVITRKKGEDINEYSINGTVYKNFGVKIPADIARAVNINQIELELETINLNFADQLDSLFLIDDSDTVKARLLNRLSGLDIIDDVLKELSEDKREQTSQSKMLDKFIAEQADKLMSYADLDVKKRTLYTLDVQMQDFEKRQIKFDSLYSIKDGVEKWKEGRKYVGLLSDKVTLLDVIDIDAMEKTLDGIEDTLRLVKQIQRLNVEISLAEKELAKISKVNIQEMLVSLTAIEEKSELINDLSDYLTKKTKLSLLEVGKNGLIETEKAYNECKGRLDKLLSGKTCPLCGTKLEAK